MDDAGCGGMVLCAIRTIDDGLSSEHPLLRLFLQEHQLVNLRMVWLYRNHSRDGLSREDVVDLYRALFRDDHHVLLVGMADNREDCSSKIKQEVLVTFIADFCRISGSLSVRHPWQNGL